MSSKASYKHNEKLNFTYVQMSESYTGCPHSPHRFLVPKWKMPTSQPDSVTFGFPDFCQFIEGLGFGKFGLGKRVWVSVLENIVLEKSLGFGFGILGHEKN